MNESVGLMNVDVHKGGGKTKHNTIATKKVNPNLLLNACNISSPNNQLNNKFRPVLILMLMVYYVKNQIWKEMEIDNSCSEMKKQNCKP